MAIRLSTSKAALYGIVPKKGTMAAKRAQYGGYASQLEQHFAAYLAEGGWHTIVYEPWQFILVHGDKPVRYTPDFLCIPDEEDIRAQYPLKYGVLFEVKGRWRPKDRVVVKHCAEMWPQFRMVGVQKKHGVWEYEYFN